MKRIYGVLLCLCILSAHAEGAEMPGWMVLTLQGEELIQAGKYEHGLDLFLQAEDQQKRSTRLYMNIAVCYKFLSEKAASSEQRKEYYFTYIAYLKKVLALDPLHPDGRYLLDTHLGIVPEDVPFKSSEARRLYTSGRIGLKQGSYEAARELLKKALDTERHPDILKSLAIISFQKQDFQKTAKLLRESLEINPIQHDAYMILGEISEGKNRLVEAKRAYIKALASYPNYFPAREKISLINKKMGKKGTFFYLIDPLPRDKRDIPPDADIRIRRLSQELKVNTFQLQCWLVYHYSVRSVETRHVEDLPETPFVLTADIETDSVRKMLDFYTEHKEQAGVTLKHFEILVSLQNKGLLKPAVFFYRWKDEFSREFVEYRKNHFIDLCRMFEEHL